MQWLVAISVSVVMVFFVVAIHHEVLVLIGKVLLPRFHNPRRWHVSLTVLVFVCAHIVEIMICAIALYVSAEWFDIGQLMGKTGSGFSTYLYYSFASYTSLGIGDLFPLGHLRLLTGVEALIGLMMIGWTASFLILEMRGFWSATNT